MSLITGLPIARYLAVFGEGDLLPPILDHLLLQNIPFSGW